MIGVVVAMNNEAEILLKNLSEKNEKSFGKKRVIQGKIYEKEIIVIVSGIGKVNAGIGAQFLIDNYKLDCIFNFGLAGGVSKNSKLCNVYQVNRAVQYDFDLSELNNVKIGALEEFDENYIYSCSKTLNYPQLTLATADRFNDDKADYKLITEYMQADLRDMEGGAIFQVCALNDVQLYCVKAVSDVAGTDSILQFRENSAKALINLEAELLKIFNEI